MMNLLQLGQFGRTILAAGGGTISVADVEYGAATGSATTISASPVVLATGGHVIVFVRFESTATTVTLADTAGNTFTSLGQVFNTNNGIEAFYCTSAIGNASNTVTATFAAARSFRSIVVVVLSGALSGVPTAATGTAATGTAVTTSAGLTLPAGSVVCAMESCFANDTLFTFSDSASGTYTDIVIPTVQWSRGAYSLRASSISGATFTFTGTAATSRRVLYAVGVPAA